MTTPARAVFEKLYGELGLSTNDAAWLVFLAGWNTALEHAAKEFEGNFATPFGRDTVHSLGVYVKGFKE